MKNKFQSLKFKLFYTLTSYWGSFKYFKNDAGTEFHSMKRIGCKPKYKSRKKLLYLGGFWFINQIVFNTNKQLNKSIFLQ